MSFFTDHLAPAEPGIADTLRTGPVAVVQPAREDEGGKTGFDYSGCACDACCAAARDNAPPLHSAPDLVPGNSSTTFSITVGSSVETSIDTLGDHDWYAVTLVAGQTYTIHSSNVFGQNPDTFLTLRDAAGTQIASDDDSGDSTYSLINFTATTSGTYYVDAGTFQNGSTGSYRISVASGFSGGDVAGSAATTATLAIDGSINGSLEAAGDRDWYAVNLVAGQTYIFRTGSIAPVTEQSAVDTVLTLRNAAGTQLLTNDDSGEFVYSAIRFTATTTGTHYLDVSGFGSTTGGFNLTAFTTPALTVYTNDQIALQLTEGYWGGTERRYNVAPGGTITYNITALTAAGQTLAREAFNLWTDATGIVFNEITTAAQITLDDTQTGAFANSSFSNGIISTSTINVGTDWLTTYGTGLNSYSFQTYIHEIGHTLGLGHGGNYNGNASYASDALYLNDSWASTIMSYFSQSENSYTAGLGYTQQFSVTPMVADAIATTALYGVNTLTRTGNTTYGFNNTSGRAIYDATANPGVSYTVFDNGGTDTLDYSGFTQNQRINLNQEAFSSVGGRVSNVWVARGSVIENAIGGTGNDTLFGNSANNALTGGAGNDILIDDLGDDILDGGAGANVIVAGRGNDTITVTATGNELYGGDGNDIFNVVSRVDTIVEYANEGIDEIRTSTTIYTLDSAPGVENLTFTTNAANAALGNALANTITGGTGSDTFNALGGNDRLIGGTGAANTVLGGAGDDTYVVVVGGDSVIEFANEGIDTVETSAAVFYLRDHVENLVYTGAGTFAGVGAGDNNRMTAGAGADYLNGEGGNDVLIGGSGADLLIGGSGTDQFLYLGGETGLDRILDFVAGVDKIAIADAGFSTNGTLQFVSGGAPVATTANSTFLYDVNSGIVSYDADGNDAGAAVQLAQLNVGLTLTVSDFVIV